MIRKLIAMNKTSLLLMGIVIGGVNAARGEDPVLLMPVFSIEAFEVNSVALKNGPTAKITVAPGDVITAKILVRNWSPQGQKLRAYQAKLDPAGYKSGTAGTVLPVGYSPGTTARPDRSGFRPST